MKTLIFLLVLMSSAYAQSVNCDNCNSVYISGTIGTTVTYYDLVITTKDNQQILIRHIVDCKTVADTLVKSADVARAKCFDE